jgi:hypothetical protein
MDLRCSRCGRLAPVLDSSDILTWEGGEMALVTDDPLMFPELVCPLCKALQGEESSPS